MERRLRRLDGVPGLEAAEHLHPSRAAVVHAQPAEIRHHDVLHQDGHSDLRGLRRIETGEAFRRHADDRHRIVVHADLLADNTGIAGESADPVAVAQHDRWMSAIHLIVILRVEHAPDCRLHAKHGKVVARHHFRLDALGLVVDAERRGHQTPAQHFRQRFGLLLKVLVQRIGVHPRAHVAAHVAGFLMQHHQLIGSSDRELPQEDLVDQRKNRGVGADSERNRGNRHNRKQRTSTEAPDRKLDIGKRGCHTSSWTNFEAQRLTRMAEKPQSTPSPLRPHL